MYAKPEQIGKQVQCPDCHSPVLVRPLKAGVSSAPATTASALRPPGARHAPAPTPIATAATNDEDELALRDEIPSPRPPAAIPGMLDDDEGEMLLRPAEEITTPKPQLPRLEDIKNDEEYQDDWRDETLEQEMRPFVSGIINFLFQPGALTRCIAYALGAALLSGGWHFAIAMLSLGGTLGTIMALLSFIAVGVATFLFVGVLSVIYLTVVQDTANGHNVVENWPDMNFFNWALDARFVISAVGLAVVPGGIVSTLIFSGSYPWAEPASAAPVVVSLWLLLPWILLSMLAGASVFSVVNLQVINAIRRSADGMLFFFMQSALVMLGVFLMVFAQWASSPILPMIAAAGLILLLFVYFRLLGRLMWYCGLKHASTEPAESPNSGQKHE